MKALFYGVAIASAAGLLCGGALKYERDQNEDPEGPQMLVPGGGRVAQTETYALLTGYSGNLPDYVIGSDAIRAAAADSPVYAPPPEETAVAYPSVDGDILAGFEREPAPYDDSRFDALAAIAEQIAADSEAAAHRIAHGPS